MKSEQALVGTRVRTLRAWAGVSVGTEGVIVEHYEIGGHEGWLVAWAPLPPYTHPSELTFARMSAAERGSPICDGFSEDELVTLEVV